MLPAQTLTKLIWELKFLKHGLQQIKVTSKLRKEALHVITPYTNQNSPSSRTCIPISCFTLSGTSYHSGDLQHVRIDAQLCTLRLKCIHFARSFVHCLFFQTLFNIFLFHLINLTHNTIVNSTVARFIIMPFFCLLIKVLAINQSINRSLSVTLLFLWVSAKLFCFELSEALTRGQD